MAFIHNLCINVDKYRVWGKAMACAFLAFPQKTLHANLAGICRPKLGFMGKKEKFEL
jgi:hypothetical protein